MGFLITECLPSLVVVASISGLAIFGWRQGLFLSTIVGLQILASCLTGLAFAPESAAFVRSLGVPPEQAVSVGYILLFALSVLTIRLAVGAGVPDNAISFAPILDTVGGATVGVVTGLVLSGGLLIGWSMADPPDWARLNVASLSLDTGSQTLAAFTRCLRSAGVDHDVLRDGEVSSASAGALGSDAMQCSEPFVDVDLNGAYSDGERYLDLDQDGRFTRQRPFKDLNGNRRRDFGLFECYRLTAWRHLAVLHTPRITSPKAVEARLMDNLGGPIYKATAADAEPDDVISFSLQMTAADDSANLTIDALTGEVTLFEPPDPETKKMYRFTVVATDRHGLKAEQPVSVTIGPGRRR